MNEAVEGTGKDQEIDLFHASGPTNEEGTGGVDSRGRKRRNSICIRGVSMIWQLGHDLVGRAGVYPLARYAVSDDALGGDQDAGGVEAFLERGDEELVASSVV